MRVYLGMYFMDTGEVSVPRFATRDDINAQKIDARYIDYIVILL